MHFLCPCGNRIHDVSDYLHYKATYVSDQDKEDLVTSLEKPGADAWGLFHRFGREFYQCESCGRLLVLLDDKTLSFSPEQESIRNLLHSVEGENWKRCLRGSWTDQKSELWWGGGGVTDQGFITDIADWESLRANYYEVLARLKANGTLRDALLRKDEEIVHQWPTVG